MESAASFHQLSFGVPWFSSDAVAWLDANIAGTDRVLEFGGGRSTVYFLGRCQAVTTVETSPEWTLTLLQYLIERPNLYRRWALRHIPVDWSPTWDHRDKGYWGERDVSLSWADARALEHRYLADSLFTGDHNVVVIDGGLRSHVMVLYHELGIYDRFEIIVIDNMELAFPSYYFTEAKLDDYVRFDFVAGSFDNKLPPEMEGRQVTTVFVKRSRMDRIAEVKTEHPGTWDRAELVAHQSFTPGPEAEERSRRWQVRIQRELAEHHLIPPSD